MRWLAALLGGAAWGAGVGFGLDSLFYDVLSEHPGATVAWSSIVVLLLGPLALLAARLRRRHSRAAVAGLLLLAVVGYAISIWISIESTTELELGVDLPG